MIAIVLGPDALLVRQTLARLANQHDPDGDATNYVDGRTVSIPTLISQVGSPGFFGQGRVVVVSDLLARASRVNRTTDDSDSDSTASSGTDLSPLFAATQPENLLILADPSLASVPAAVKRSLPAATEIIVCEPPRGEGLAKWLSETARTFDSEIDPATARFLLTRLYPQSWQTRPSNPRFDTPPDLDLLTQEIAKLAAAAHPDPIQRADVERLTTISVDDQVFRFTDAVARGRIAQAATELEKLQQAGEQPYAILAQAMQQAELAAALTVADSRDPATVGRELGLSNPARMNGIAATRRGQSAASIRAELDHVLRIDRQIKRGLIRGPEDALYSLLADPEHDDV